MSINLSSPVTGAAQSGLTSPTYTVVGDAAPAANMRQYAVTALGGTQAGVTTHSTNSPFTISFVRPVLYKALGTVNPSTGLVRAVPKNVHKVITRKGMTVLSGQPIATGIITTSIEVPAGVDLADPANLKAALSLHIGALDQLTSELGLLCLTGIL